MLKEAAKLFAKGLIWYVIVVALLQVLLLPPWYMNIVFTNAQLSLAASEKNCLEKSDVDIAMKSLSGGMYQDTSTGKNLVSFKCTDVNGTAVYNNSTNADTRAKRSETMKVSADMAFPFKLKLGNQTFGSNITFAHGVSFYPIALKFYKDSDDGDVN